MATTTIPEVKPAETTKKAPISLTASAVVKVKEIMAQQNPVPPACAWAWWAAAALVSRTPCSSRTARA